jgi:hypothetical protein
VDDCGWIPRVLLEGLQGHVGLMPSAQPPRFPFILLPLSVANANDRIAPLGKEPSDMPTEEAVRACYQSVGWRIQPSFSALQ